MTHPNFKSAIAGVAFTMLCATSAHAQDQAQDQAQDATKTWSYSGNVTADIIGVVSGGLDQDVRFIDNIGLQVNYDGSAHGLKGITATIGVLYNNDASVGELVGDVQGVSNIETGTAALRPYETWIAKTWGEDAAMLKAGIIDLNGTFDAPGVSGLFLNSSHGINPTFAQTGANGPSIFPILGLAVLGEVKVSEGLRVRAGAFDGVPGNPDDPKRTDLAWTKSDGALLVGEAEYSAGKARLVAGAWGYTQPSDGLLRLSGSQRNAGFYGSVDYEMSDTISYFVRAGHAKKELNYVENYLAAGAVWTGPFATRKDDQFGVAIAHARLSGNIVDTGATQEAETNIELTYAAPITDHFTLQGDVQYVINPSGVDFIDNAVVLGLRVKFEFGG
jgi:porin